MLPMVSRKVDLSLEKLRQWKMKQADVSISLPRLQIGLSESWKLCLNLCSLRWPICLILHLMYVNSNWIYAQKTTQGKWETQLPGRWKLYSPCKSLRLNESLSISLSLFIEKCILQMRFNLNKIFASEAWAEMSRNELRRAWMSLNKSKFVQMSLNKLIFA